MTLGPEMTAEGWTEIGDQNTFVDLVWLHVPSHRSVQIFEIPRANYEGPVWREPADPAAVGYVVGSMEHDEYGNPERTGGFWIEGFGRALRIARETRAAILAETAAKRAGRQLTFDDAIERNGGPEP